MLTDERHLSAVMFINVSRLISKHLCVADSELETCLSQGWLELPCSHGLFIQYCLEAKLSVGLLFGEQSYILFCCRVGFAEAGFVV